MEDGTDLLRDANGRTGGFPLRGELDIPARPSSLSDPQLRPCSESQAESFHAHRGEFSVVLRQCLLRSQRPSEGDDRSGERFFVDHMYLLQQQTQSLPLTTNTSCLSTLASTSPVRASESWSARS